MDAVPLPFKTSQFNTEKPTNEEFVSMDIHCELYHYLVNSSMLVE